jgi:hypothetical protein
MMDVKKPDDMLFNGYEDSVEDEKANQEAYERSIKFSEQSEEERLKKLSFLTEQLIEEPQEEFLIKPRIGPPTSPKIEIETNLFSSVDKVGNSFEPDNKSKSILGIFNMVNNPTLDEDFVHKPIEFTKREHLPELEVPMAEDDSPSIIENDDEINLNEPMDSNFQNEIDVEINPNIDQNESKSNAEQHDQLHKKRDIKELQKLEEEKLENGQPDIIASDPISDISEVFKENITEHIVNNGNNIDYL